MGIFNLNNGDGVKPTEPVTLPNADKPKTGITEDGNTKPIEDTEVKSNEAVKKELEAKKEKVIVLDGPLSQIYTQALNLTFAKESTMMMVSLYNSAVAKQKENATPTDLYVYCCDGDNLTQDDVIASSDSIQNIISVEGYKNVILAIECGRVVNSKVGLLSDLVQSMGARVCLTRKRALETIKIAAESL